MRRRHLASSSRLDLNQTQIMEIHLLFVALGIPAVTVSLIAWHFVRKAEAEDTASAERRLRPHAGSIQSGRTIRSSRDARRSRPLTTRQSRFDHPALTLSAPRPS